MCVGGEGGTDACSVQMTFGSGPKELNTTACHFLEALTATTRLARPHKREGKRLIHIGAVHYIPLTDQGVPTAAYLFFIACKGAVSIALIGLLGDLPGSVPRLLLAQLLNQILHTHILSLKSES